MPNRYTPLRTNVMNILSEAEVSRGTNPLRHRRLQTLRVALTQGLNVRASTPVRWGGLPDDRTEILRGCASLGCCR
jgi:hypothetical protein